MTDNPTPDEAALTAALIERVTRGIGSDYYTVYEDATEAFRLLLTRQQEREKRLREFVHRVATTQLGSDEEMMMSMVDCIEEALKLLTELDGDESN